MAKAINGEVVNADSMQVYEGIEIISNKHPQEEREGVEHHVMNHVKWTEDYFIHRFTREANKAINEIHKKGKTPIIIGGTHYYLQSLLFKNKTVGETEDFSKERKLSDEQISILDGTTENIIRELKKIDPLIADKFHPQDRRKLRRALEIFFYTGRRPSDIYRDQKLEELGDSSLKYNSLFFWVYSDPDILKERLDNRVDKMMDLGALKEIEQLFLIYQHLHPRPSCTSGVWQVIGFKEFLPWLEKGKSDEKLFNEGIERMKIRTRQYAKYQTKWIKKLLAVELTKEERFAYRYGGKIYLLDSTDLSNWNTNVSQVGIEIAKQFLETGPASVTHPQAPSHLLDLLPDARLISNLNSNKVLGSEANWKHFECPVCTDKQGNKLVAVGEANWDIHIKSRRHKRLLKYVEKKKRASDQVENTNKIQKV